MLVHGKVADDTHEYVSVVLIRVERQRDVTVTLTVIYPCNKVY